MRTRVALSFNVGRENRRLAVRVLEPIGCLEGLTGQDSYLPGYFDQCFDEDDPRLGRLRIVLKEAGIDWNERWNYIHTDDELRASPLLLLRVRLERDIGDQPRDRFDFSNGCPNCGIGARQIAPLVVPQRVLPKKKGRIFQTLKEGHRVLAEPLARSLLDAGVSGLEVRQVVSPREEPLPWWQMETGFEMPPMNDQTRWQMRGHDRHGHLMEGCTKCGRDNFFDGGFESAPGRREPVVFTYDRSRLGNVPLPDVVRTYECFGISWFDEARVALAGPRLLVKPKVFELFRKLKVHGVDFEPVRIIED